jgi:hypothetical protein
MVGLRQILDKIIPRFSCNACKKETLLADPHCKVNHEEHNAAFGRQQTRRPLNRSPCFLNLPQPPNLSN